MATFQTHPLPTPAELKLVPSTRAPESRRRDSLFAALDGSRLRLGGKELEVEVYSITDHVAGRWVQLGFRHTDEHFLTLYLPRQATFEQASKALLRLVAESGDVDEGGPNEAA